MAQSRIEELEEEVERLEKELEEANDRVADLEDEIEELEDEECDCAHDYETGQVYSVCFERVFVASEEPTGSLSIPMQYLMEAIAEKSKDYKSINQFADAIKNL